MTSTSLASQVVVEATAWLYSPTSTKFKVQVKSSGVLLGEKQMTEAGWHSMPVSLDGSQAQLDGISIRVSTGESPLDGYGVREIYAAFLKLGIAPAESAMVTRLRPTGDRPTESPWEVKGAAHAWEALDDEVSETQTPSKSDYLMNGTEFVVPWRRTEVDLGTTSLAGQPILGAAAWVYAPNAKSFTVEVKSRGSLLAKDTLRYAGWHVIPIPLSGDQAQLDDLSIYFESPVDSGVREIYASFVRLVLEVTPFRVYWGSWIDGEVYGGGGDAPWDQGTWNVFEGHTGKPVSIVHFGQPAPWTQSFAAEPLNLTKARGAIPLMDMGSNGATLAEIASGAQDAFLTSWAKSVKGYEKPFFFRWDWEMNGTWFKWGEEAAANPANYIAAWQHFREVADAQGATNITWVWCPNVKFTGSTSLAFLYPGDAYVDWTCIDAYNFGTNPIKPGTWTSFSSLVQPTYSELLSIAPNKPIMLGETASTEIGGSKSEWIADALGTQIPKNFPKIKAVNWFNWNIVENGSRWDWQIESSASAQASFANVISSPFYAGNTFGGLPSLTRIQPLP